MRLVSPSEGSFNMLLLACAVFVCLCGSIARAQDTKTLPFPTITRQGNIGKLWQIIYSERKYPHNRVIAFSLAEEPGIHYETSISRAEQLNLITILSESDYLGIGRAVNFTTNENAIGWRVRITAEKTGDPNVYRLMSFEKTGE